MTREETISRLKNIAWLYGSAEREQNIEAINMAIEALKAEVINDIPKWTVYNKEKPQKVSSYLVTHTTDSGYYVDYDYWTVCGKFKYHPTDVVAWMPFPKPYKGGDKE